MLLERANQALGRLDGITSILPDVSIFLHAYVRKEAVLSSQIEGTQSSLSDLLMFEEGQAEGELGDVQDVSNYVAAMNHGLARLEGGFPLSLRLIREIHGVLLSHGRGSEKEPGEFRRSQNWIGGTRPGNAFYVPPPPDRLMNCLGALELFLHDETTGLPLLVRAALIHVQFESIHPFLDGNGRVGRLLITLMLCASGALRVPALYLSLYLKQHRQTYYELLTAVRTNGGWESWIEFFLEGVKESADQAVNTAHRLLKLIEEDRAKVEQLGRGTPTALRLHHFAQKHVALSAATASERLGVSLPTIRLSIEHLERLQILREVTGRQRGRTFTYHRYLSILSEGTEPLAAHP